MLAAHYLWWIRNTQGFFSSAVMNWKLTFGKVCQTFNDMTDLKYCVYLLNISFYHVFNV